MSTNKFNTSEKEIELINNVAKKIVDSEMESPAVWLLQTIKPLAFVGGELSYFYLAPYLPFLEDLGYTFLDTFEKRKNIELLIKTVERLQKEQSREKKKTQGPSLLSKIMSKLNFRAASEKKVAN